MNLFLSSSFYSIHLHICDFCFVFASAIFVRVTVAVMKHHDQKKLGKERACLVSASTSLLTVEGRIG